MPGLPWIYSGKYADVAGKVRRWLLAENNTKKRCFRTLNDAQRKERFLVQKYINDFPTAFGALNISFSGGRG